MQALHRAARVAKLADARDLKSRVPKRTYRFDSGPGHHCAELNSTLLAEAATSSTEQHLTYMDQSCFEIGLAVVALFLLAKFAVQVAIGSFH